MNAVANHPLSRREALEYLRSVKRSVLRLRDKLHKKGDLSNKSRHEVYDMTEDILNRVEKAIRALDAARPERQKSKKRRPPLQYFGIGRRED